MKAHRRNGIPTLMLDGGGAPSTRSGGLASGLVQALRSRDNYEAELRQQRRQPPMTESQLARDIRRFNQVIDPAIQIPKGISALFNMAKENIFSPFAQYATKQVPSPYAIQQAAEESAQAQAQAQADLATTEAQRAADALSGGVLRPQIAPTETAPPPAETATTPAETAATSAATPATPAGVGPADYGSGIVGVDAQTDAAAGYGTSGTTGTAAEQPIAIKPDDSVTGTLNSILLGEAAKFDERERLKQLKETFGLNLSDMERAAPALAFSFALMGATKEPGESPLQAFIRSAGAAGQSALAQQQALDAKQRSLDAALISPILTERRAAEAIERDREWVTYWDGTTKDDLPNFKSTKMNARQIEEAQKAGIELVPLGLAGSYISQSALVQKARKQAEVDLAKSLREQEKERGKAIEGTVRTVGEGPDKRTVREIMVEVNNQLTPIVYNADPGKSFDRNSIAVNQTVQSVGIVRDMRKSVDEGALGLSGGVRFVEGSIKDFFVGGKGFTLDQTVGALRSAGGVEGDLVWRGDDPAAESLLKRSMGEAYNKDLSAQENYRRFVESTAVFASVTDDQIKELREQAAGVSDDRERSVYEARIDYLINQRSLAAALAPLLLGESGRTISDADRIRVIQLMGEFADSSKQGLLSRPEAAMRALNNLESVLTQNANKFAKSIRTEAEELDFASKAQVHLGKKGDMAFVMTNPVKNSLQRAMDSLNAYEKLFPPSGGSSADQNAKPTVHAGSASGLTASK
jgi:hypothetical protein